MAMAPERSKQLHNFSMPYLKWGSQRFLKCMKLSSNSNHSSALDHPSAQRQSKSISYQFRARPINSKGSNFTKLSSLMNHFKQKPSNANNDPSSSIREEKIMLDIREDSKKLKFSIPDEGGEDESAAARPWNLRTRRAACKAPQDEKNLELGSSSTKGIMKKEKNRTALIVSLSKDELEEDFAVLVGRLPRRPKKRPRAVQKQLDTLFPGLLLTEITLDSYKVADVPEA